MFKQLNTFDVYVEKTLSSVTINSGTAQVEITSSRPAIPLQITRAASESSTFLVSFAANFTSAARYLFDGRCEWKRFVDREALLRFMNSLEINDDMVL